MRTGGWWWPGGSRGACACSSSRLNGDPASPFPAAASELLTYQTTVPTVMVTVSVAVTVGALLPAIVRWKLSVPE